jgi:hypothetical protein
VTTVQSFLYRVCVVVKAEVVCVILKAYYDEWKKEVYRLLSFG